MLIINVKRKGYGQGAALAPVKFIQDFFITGGRGKRGIIPDVIERSITPLKKNVGEENIEIPKTKEGIPILDATISNDEAVAVQQRYYQITQNIPSTQYNQPVGYYYRQEDEVSEYLPWILLGSALLIGLVLLKRE